jgi:hypothetical protein
LVKFCQQKQVGCGTFLNKATSHYSQWMALTSSSQQTKWSPRSATYRSYLEFLELVLTVNSPHIFECLHEASCRGYGGKTEVGCFHGTYGSRISLIRQKWYRECIRLDSNPVLLKLKLCCSLSLILNMCSVLG